MDTLKTPKKRKFDEGVVSVEESVTVSPSQDISVPQQFQLISQAIEHVESGLRGLFYPLQGSQADGRDDLIRAATLLEVIDVDEETSFNALLSAAKRITSTLLQLPPLLDHQYKHLSHTATRGVGEDILSAADTRLSESKGGGVWEDEDENENVEEYAINERRQEIWGKFSRGFAEVVGSEDAKQVLHESIVLPLSLPPDLRSSLLTGIRGGTGNVLLFGPPGTGKTMLVAAAAREAGARLILIKPSDVLSKYHGESEGSLKRAFSLAHKPLGQKAKLCPTVLFFDEFDSIACTRTGGEEGMQGRRLLAELLLQLNALKESNSEGRRESGNIVVVAATNRIEDIDEAAIRRFETRVYVGVPESCSERVQLIQGFLRPGNVAHMCTQAELLEVARLTDGWSGSDIECMCRDAAMAPLRRVFPRESDGVGGKGGDGLITSNSNVSFGSLLITAGDFRDACERAIPCCRNAEHMD